MADMFPENIKTNTVKGSHKICRNTYQNGWIQAEKVCGNDKRPQDIEYILKRIFGGKPDSNTTQDPKEGMQVFRKGMVQEDKQQAPCYIKRSTPQLPVCTVCDKGSHNGHTGNPNPHGPWKSHACGEQHGG